jgi:hypothetical protein
MLDFTITPRQFHLLVAPLLSFLPQAVIWHRSDYRAHNLRRKRRGMQPLEIQKQRRSGYPKPG